MPVDSEASTALVPVLPGRPAVVWVGTTAFYVSVHDREFLAQRRAWKRRLAGAHPDLGNSGFVTVRRAQERWFAEERRWYDLCGIEPPEPIPPCSFGARTETKTIERRQCSQCRRWFTPRRSIERTCGGPCSTQLSARVRLGRQQPHDSGTPRHASAAVLQALEHEDEVGVRTLASRLDLREQHITLIVSRLRKKGLPIETRLQNGVLGYRLDTSKVA